MISRTRLALVLLLSLIASGRSARVDALPSGASGFDIYYYSDDSMSEVVGERYMACTGTPYSWGVRTAYSDALTWQCQPSGGGGGGGGSCTTTTCQRNQDASGNIWYSDCVTSTSSDYCFWRMCGTDQNGNPVECGGS